MHRLLALVVLAVLSGGCASADPGQLPLTEDFSGSCEWPTRWDGVKRGECADGVYRFELLEDGGGPYTAWREVVPSSFTVEVEVTVDLPAEGRSDGHAFGLGCWTGVRGAGFLFMVFGDGRVTVFEDDPASGLVPIFEQATPLPAFRLPARLRARCAGGPDGTTPAFSVNGAGVALPASSRPSGAFSVVGFAAATGAGAAVVEFDDLAARRD